MQRLRNIRKTETQLRRCHRCNGLGDAPCRTCGGSGKVILCHDRNGAPQFGRCEGCYGRRTTRCPTCHGQKFVQ